MEISQEREKNTINSSPTDSPHSNGSSRINVSNGAVLQIHSPNPRSETSPYPTTFVQADTSNFKQVVQMLTGSSETAKQASNSKPNHQDPSSSSSSSKNLIPPIKTTPPKKQSFKLYERRNQLKNSLMINTLVPGFAQASGFSPIRKPEILSPSMLDFPKLALSSPVTPLSGNEDPFNKSSPSLGNSSEEKAIAEKGFYLHPSPRTTTPRDAEPPQLLPLFPVESPRLSGSSSS